MGNGSPDLAVLVEKEHFGGPLAENGMVVDGDAVHTRQDLNEVEMQIREALQGFGPIGP